MDWIGSVPFFYTILIMAKFLYIFNYERIFSLLRLFNVRFISFLCWVVPSQLVPNPISILHTLRNSGCWFRMSFFFYKSSEIDQLNTDWISYISIFDKFGQAHYDNCAVNNLHWKDRYCATLWQTREKLYFHALLTYAFTKSIFFFLKIFHT